MHRRPLVLVLAALSPVATAATPVNPIEGRVTSVTDGDTLTVLDASEVRYQVRLAGIDAPEKDQPSGQKSRQGLSRMVLGRDVRIEWTRRDHNGRYLAKVWVTPVSHPCTNAGEPCPKTLDVGRAQLTVGLAWHSSKYECDQSEEDRLAYAFDEQEARARKAGLWSEPDPNHPRDLDHRTAGCPIKKATASGICHEPGTSSYSSLKKFTPYPTLQACLMSGGRLPKKVD